MKQLWIDGCGQKSYERLEVKFPDGERQYACSLVKDGLSFLGWFNLSEGNGNELHPVEIGKRNPVEDIYCALAYPDNWEEFRGLRETNRILVGMKNIGADTSGFEDYSFATIRREGQGNDRRYFLEVPCKVPVKLDAGSSE